LLMSDFLRIKHSGKDSYAGSIFPV